MKRLRRAGVKVAAVLSGLVVALLAGELLVRTLGVRTDMPIGTLQVSSSVAGTLDRAHVDAFSTRPDVVRIAFLSDSFTYGLGVEPEETFVHKTGVLLNRRMGQRYATINLVRAGEDLIRERAVYDAARSGRS